MLYRQSSPIADDVPPAIPVVEDSIDSRLCGLADAVRSGWYLRDTQELLRGFSIAADDVVLDLGCGEGAATLFAAQCGAEVIFVDSDAAKIAALRSAVAAAGARAARGIVSDTDPLPLPAACASKIIAMEVLEHVEDPARVLRELVRVARPGAKFLLSVPDPVGEVLQQAVAPDAYFQAPNHVRIFQREEFAQLIVDAGLIIEQKHYSGFFWSMWMSFYWVCQRASGEVYEGAARDKITPPYHPLLEQWARTWFTLINMPEGAALKAAFDEFMPKSQTIIASKL